MVNSYRYSNSGCPDYTTDKDWRGSMPLIRRISLGNFGDTKSVHTDISKLLIDCGLGYRVYFIRHSSTTVILLAGGDKHTQGADIERIVKIAQA